MEKKKKIKGYTIFMDRMLGQGAFGKVFVGEQDQTKFRVAIKALNKITINRDPYIRNALFSQIDILKCLKSPNIVGFLEVMESDNYYYIIQEYCNGGDLKGVMDKRGRIPEAEAIQMLTQVCNGFVELIKQGIIHRDLKPQNILINESVLKLADFGFSKRTSNARMKNQTMVGTPLYMSLQILKGQPYTSKCDIWALGLIFYELMCGKTPWDGNSQYQLINNIERIPLQFPPYVSQISRDFISKCCKINERDRFSWDDLLRHPIFSGKFTNYDKGGEIKYQDQYKSLMRDLRMKIKVDNIDLERLFKRLGFNNQTEMKINDFEKFLAMVSPNLSVEEVRYIFEKLDTDKNNTITYQELQNELKKYNIPLQSAVKELPQYIRKQSKESDNTLNPKMIAQMQKKLQNGFMGFADKLQREHISLNSYFASFDKSKDGGLTRQQFINVMQNMGFPFNEKQMSYVFKVIDTDRAGAVTFYEFYTFFCKVVGEPMQPYKQNKTSPFQTPRQGSPAQNPIQGMMQQQQMGYQQSNMGNFMGMGGMGKPDSLFGAQLMMQQPQMGMPLGIGGMGGMGGMGGLGMGMQQQFYQQQPHQQQPFNQAFGQGQNRRFPGMPAFTGNGWDF